MPHPSSRSTKCMSNGTWQWEGLRGNTVGRNINYATGSNGTGNVWHWQHHLHEIEAINHFISLHPYTCTNVLQQIWLYYIILLLNECIFLQYSLILPNVEWKRAGLASWLRSLAERLWLQGNSWNWQPVLMLCQTALYSFIGSWKTWGFFCFRCKSIFVE